MEWRLTVEVSRVRGGNRIIIADFNDIFERNEFIKKIAQRFPKKNVTITIALCQNCTFRNNSRYYSFTSHKLFEESLKGGYNIDKAIKILYPETAKWIKRRLNK